MKTHFLIFVLLISIHREATASRILIPLDESQKNHLKSYGIAYWMLAKGEHVDWLLNYRGGSFMMEYHQTLENELIIRGVSYQVISEAQVTDILNEIADPEANMDIMGLDKAPKIAVYSPKSKQPWDDAVTLVLAYSEIPYDVIFDYEVMDGLLPKYDWLHLHHEDFTGQYGKFYATYRGANWYKEQQIELEQVASHYGFAKVSKLKAEVVNRIRDYVAGGGFLFAMCSATDSYDIALAAEGLDICESMYDGDPADPQAQSKLDFSRCFAFEKFRLERDPFKYEFSNIDNSPSRRKINRNSDYFQLSEFSAKWDPVPAMLTQNHTRTIKGFMGQTTAFTKTVIKPEVLVMGENTSAGEARYVHGEFGKGTWTFYGGHDPEDYQHFVGEEPTDLNLHPNSPGYRLILNNVLFPSAKKKKQKT